MAGRRYTPAQKAAIGLLQQVHMEKVQARATLKMQIEAAFKDSLVDIGIRESQAANAALAAGITKTDIGRAMGTANFETIKAVLARTAGDLTAADFMPAETQRFVLVTPPEGLTPAKIRVTMEGDDWEKFVKRNKHRFRRQQFADETEIVVDVVAGGQPSYPGRLGDNDLSTVNMYDHPIMGWLKYGPGKDEFAAWLLQHPEAVGETAPEDDDNEDDYEEDE